MKHLAVTVLAMALAVSTGRAASAEDALPEDVIEIQSCIEGVRDYNASADPGQEASRDECIGTIARPCVDTDEGQSTYGMMECHGRELAVWDSMLNDNYTALKDAVSDTEFRALRDTQLKWIAYRDAKCEWPAVFFEGGTISGPISASCLNEATARRANELAEYLGWTQN
jgi:uncharacterized protein YecT (DUF1311 family)